MMYVQGILADSKYNDIRILVAALKSLPVDNSIPSMVARLIYAHSKYNEVDKLPACQKSPCRQQHPKHDGKAGNSTSEGSQGHSSPVLTPLSFLLYRLLEDSS